MLGRRGVKEVSTSKVKPVLSNRVEHKTTLKQFLIEILILLIADGT